uniref:Ribosomal RNA small subunit methyltransferase E n=1 Tax=Ammonifex degensii TaxID=42838 RepID=A0A7C1F3F7_9THEO
MTRLFVPPAQWQGKYAVVQGADVKYLTRVLRLGPGDTVTIFDGEGRIWEAVIDTVRGAQAVLNLTRALVQDVEPRVHVTLLQAVPKGDKMDLVVQKTTELGVARIVPVLTERVVVRFEGHRAVAKQKRWQKIAQEAARQSGRITVPVVDGICTFREALTLFAKEDSLGIMPWEGEEKLSLRAVLAGKEPARVTLFVGPEGGFSRAEVEAARDAGFYSVSLGRRILRTETAGVVVLALVLYSLGELA